jgi:hypothetical protein
MDMVTEFLFGLGGLALLGVATLAWLAVLLMWLTRRQIKETT